MSHGDHPSGNRGGAVCIYYKEYLLIEMVYSIVSLYRSRIQSASEFEIF